MTEYSKIQYVALHVSLVIQAIAIVALVMGLIDSILYTISNQSQFYWIIIFIILIVVLLLSINGSLEELSTMKIQKEVDND